MTIRGEVNMDDVKMQLQKEISQLRIEVDDIRKILVVLQSDDHLSCDVKMIVSRLVKVIDGDPTTDVEGLRQRVKTLEVAMALIDTDRKRDRNVLKGVAIGLGFTSVGSIGSMIAVISQVIGVKP